MYPVDKFHCQEKLAKCAFSKVRKMRNAFSGSHRKHICHYLPCCISSSSPIPTLSALFQQIDFSALSLHLPWSGGHPLLWRSKRSQGKDILWLSVWVRSPFRCGGMCVVYMAFLLSLHKIPFLENDNSSSCCYFLKDLAICLSLVPHEEEAFSFCWTLPSSLKRAPFPERVAGQH